MWVLLVFVCVLSDSQVKASEPFLFGLVEEESDWPRDWGDAQRSQVSSSSCMTNFYSAFNMILTFLPFVFNGRKMS